MHMPEKVEHPESIGEQISSIVSSNGTSVKERSLIGAKLRDAFSRAVTSINVGAVMTQTLAGGGLDFNNYTPDFHPPTFSVTLDGSGFMNAGKLNSRVAENLLIEMGYTENEAVEIATIPDSLLRILLTSRVEFDGGTTPADILEFSAMAEEEGLLYTTTGDGKTNAFLNIPNIVGVSIPEPETLHVSTSEARGVDVLFQFAIEGTIHTIKVTSQLSRLQAEAAVDSIRYGIGQDSYFISLAVFEQEPFKSGVYISTGRTYGDATQVLNPASRSFSSPYLIIPLHEQPNPLWGTYFGDPDLSA